MLTITHQDLDLFRGISLDFVDDLKWIFLKLLLVKQAAQNLHCLITAIKMSVFLARASGAKSLLPSPGHTSALNICHICAGIWVGCFDELTALCTRLQVKLFTHVLFNGHTGFKLRWALHVSFPGMIQTITSIGVMRHQLRSCGSFDRPPTCFS